MVYAPLAWGVYHAVQDYRRTGDPLALIPYYHALKYSDMETTAIGLALSLPTIGKIYAEGTLGFAMRVVPRAAVYQYPTAAIAGFTAVGLVGLGVAYSETSSAVGGFASPAASGMGVSPGTTDYGPFGRHFR